MPDGCATLEAQLMDLCDDIAYSTHDLEDGIRAGKIQMDRGFFEDDRLVAHVVKEITNDPSYAEANWENVDQSAMVKQVLSITSSNGKPSMPNAIASLRVRRREMKARWVRNVRERGRHHRRSGHGLEEGDARP